MALFVREQVHPGSVMLKDNARSPQAEPVSAQRPDGLKFSPFSSRRKIPSEAKSEGGGNIRIKKIPSVQCSRSTASSAIEAIIILSSRHPFELINSFSPTEQGSAHIK